MNRTKTNPSIYEKTGSCLDTRCQQLRDAEETVTLSTLSQHVHDTVVVDYDIMTCVQVIEDCTVTGPHTVADETVDSEVSSLENAIRHAAATALLEHTIEDTDVQILDVSASYRIGN
jgi:hypothetical protein